MVKEECASMVAEECSEACPVLVSPCLAVADGCSKLSCAEIAAKGFCECPGCEGMVKEECSAACSEEGLKPPASSFICPDADVCSTLSCEEIAAEGLCQCPGCEGMVAEECSEACLEISLKLQATAQAGDTKTKSVAKAEDTKKKSVKHG